jgi:hypothetical protein
MIFSIVDPQKKRGFSTSALPVAPDPSHGPTQPLPQAASHSPAAGQNIFVFEPVDASDISYNNSAEKFKVHVFSQNSEPLYLVQNDRIGTGLIDTGQGRVYDAESAVLSTDGDRIRLDLDQAEAITPSGVDVLKGKSKNRIEAWWDQDRLAFTVLLGKEAQPPATHVQDVSKPQTPAADLPAPGLLFENSDFEKGDLTNWTAVGTAFKCQPTKGDNPTARRRRGQPSSHQGEFWIGTFEKYQGLFGSRPGQVQGDKPTGTLTSIPFQLKGNRISFLVGGGKHLKSEYVALLIEGREVLKATGRHNEQMQREVWDVTAFKGKQAQIIINDQLPRGWGHINADDFRYEGE